MRVRHSSHGPRKRAVALFRLGIRSGVDLSLATLFSSPNISGPK
jgi:hypothetical protein